MTNVDGMLRVREYLVSQAERYDWLDLWPRIACTRGEFINQLGQVNEAQSAWRPAPEQWSIREVAWHALYYSEAVLALIEALARGEEPAASPVDALGAAPPDDGTPFATIRRRLIAHSLALTALPTRMGDGTNLVTTHTHPFFGALNARAWFLFGHVHDLDHMQQLQHIASQPGYPGKA